jgi:Double-stranded RNA binding motif/Aminotransferase class-V
MAVATKPFAEVRADFPVLDREINGNSLVYLDSAATAQKPRQVIETMERFYSHSYGTVHRGVYELGREATEQFELTEDLRRSDNVLAALIESAIAALVLEYGLDAVAPAVLEAFEGQIEEALHAPGDFKTRLQEEAAKRGWKVTYSVVEVEGPAHARLFTCAALVAGVPRGLGTGRSKKEAQQAAAAVALASL